VLLDPTGTGALGATGESCRFNYAAFVQDLPAVDRNSLVANATWRINDDMTAYATYAWSNNNLYAQYAPPAQPFGINPTTRNPTLYNRYVVPFLAANNLTIVPPSNPSAPWATVGYRGVSLGGRADNYDTSWNHFAAGLDGRWSGWDYGLRFNTAETKFTDTFAGGYTDSAGLNAAIAAGLYDPVAGTGANSVTPFILKQLYQKINSNLSDLHLTAQHDMWQMAGGKSIIAFGADYIWAKYKQNYGPYGLVGSGYDPVQNDPATGLPYTATAVGGPGGQVPVNASRNNWGIYSEALFPVLKNLEFTGSLRYDYYDKVNSKFVFSTTPDANGNYPQIANADLGNTFNDLTYKISARWDADRDGAAAWLLWHGLQGADVQRYRGASGVQRIDGEQLHLSFPRNVGLYRGKRPVRLAGRTERPVRRAGSEAGKIQAMGGGAHAGIRSSRCRSAPTSGT
jgi:iron complex outermembrane receptor protein